MDYLITNWATITIIILAVWEILGRLIPSTKDRFPSAYIEDILKLVRLILDLIPNKKK